MNFLSFVTIFIIQGETIKLSDIYVGSQKELKSRLIVTKLIEENKIKRELTLSDNVRKKNMVLKKSRMDFNSINAYITNVDSEILSTNQVHDLYSLRWQIEIMFKVWKSIFKISQVKKVKIERFKYFLYGRLIALLLSSSMVFTAKNIIMEEDNKEISEIKAFGSLVEYLPKLSREIFKRTSIIVRLLKRIILNFKRLGIKSRKKNKKIVIDILKFIKLDSSKIEKIAS